MINTIKTALYGHSETSAEAYRNPEIGANMTGITEELISTAEKTTLPLSVPLMPVSEASGSQSSLPVSAVTAVSHKEDIRSSAEELANTFADASLKWVLFFCSAQLDVEALATELERLMPDKS
ncbi:hypothetical protein ABMA58_13215, partial [Oceanospirillum sp. HFRX-1_2]